MASPAQIAANHANAQKSTGPVTSEGKAAVAKNALKTGLTGRAILLPSDDAELYSLHIESFRARYNPIGDAELELVQSIADTAWRIARIPALEAGIFAVGRVKLADLHAEEKDERLRAAMIQTEVFMAYERQLRNLQTQEARLRRNLEKDQAALSVMQQKRISERETRLTKAAKVVLAGLRDTDPAKYQMPDFGFEFSVDEIQDRAKQISDALPCTGNKIAA